MPGQRPGHGRSARFRGGDPARLPARARQLHRGGRCPPERLRHGERPEWRARLRNPLRRHEVRGRVSGTAVGAEPRPTGRRPAAGHRRRRPGAARGSSGSPALRSGAHAGVDGARRNSRHPGAAPGRMARRSARRRLRHGRTDQRRGRPGLLRSARPARPDQHGRRVTGTRTGRGQLAHRHRTSRRPDRPAPRARPHRSRCQERRHHRRRHTAAPGIGGTSGRRGGTPVRRRRCHRRGGDGHREDRADHDGRRAVYAGRRRHVGPVGGHGADRTVPRSGTLRRGVPGARRCLGRGRANSSQTNAPQPRRRLGRWADVR